jgi:hypothetical protein
MAVNECESIITRSTTNALKEIDICGIIQKELSKYLQSDEFGDIIKSLFNDIMADIVQEAIQPLQARIESLEEQIELISEKSNDNEQYSRRSNIRIFGLETRNSSSEAAEDCTKVVVDFCKDELGVDVKKDEIDRAHRVGRPNGNKARALIVKFKSHFSKIKVMKAKRQLKGKRIYVNEDLTKHNLWLLKQTKEACKGKGYVYTVDGNIFVKSRDSDNLIRVRRLVDLEHHNYEVSF